MSRTSPTKSTEHFSASFRQQSGKLFSLDSLLPEVTTRLGLHSSSVLKRCQSTISHLDKWAPWQGHSSLASRKKSGSFASTSGQQQTSETENESAAFIKDGIRARHKQRAALATMDDILNLYAREGPQEPSIFFCRGCAHLHASQALAKILYAPPDQMLTHCSLMSTYALRFGATG